jgi:hypothetical protein
MTGIFKSWFPKKELLRLLYPWLAALDHRGLKGSEIPEFKGLKGRIPGRKGTRGFKA